LSTHTPWHKRGVRVHRFVYSAWYIAQLLVGAFIIVSALVPTILLALGAIYDAFEIILTGIAAGVTGLLGLVLLWLAVHRLRNPVKPAS
jgi:hypothetical protein